MKNHFSILGVSDFETEILLALSDCGPQPASTIAAKLGFERTKTYRHLEKLSKAGFIRTTDRNGVRTYFLRDVSDIERRIDEKIADIERLRVGKAAIIEAFRRKNRDSQVPEVTVYGRSWGMENIFDDMESDIQSQKLLSVTLLATNTYFERGSSTPGKTYAEEFFSKLKRRNIHMEIFLASGGFTMERFQKASFNDLSDFPAGISTLHLFLIGKNVYLVTYSDIPQGIKIENETLGDVLHLVFGTIGNR